MNEVLEDGALGLLFGIVVFVIVGPFAVALFMTASMQLKTWWNK